MNESCIFCKSTDLVTFSEHYTFCKNCSAIYTFNAVQEINCTHITKDSACVERPAWFKADRDSVAYIKELGDRQVCSVCGAEVIADGW